MTKITNQIKKSYKLAKECKSLKSILSRLIHSSLEAGKKIRNQTRLSDGSSSASYASVEKICSLVNDISKEINNEGELINFLVKDFKEDHKDINKYSSLIDKLSQKNKK